MTTIKIKIATLCSLSVLSPMLAHGLGLRLPDQDAFATGRGEAFAATANNPSAIYYNPAGITQLDGLEVRGGFYGIDLQDRYSNGNTTIHSRNGFQGTGQLFVTDTLTNIPLSLGLGVYSPYGLSMEWPGNSPFVSAGQEGSLQYMTINPVLAWKVLPSLSISAGPTINYGKIDLRRDPFGPAFGSEFRFVGDDVKPGFNAGIMWQPVDQLSFGASYRSATRMAFHGYALQSITPFLPGSSETTMDMHLPQNIVGGVSYRPSTNWNVEVNVDWTDWHQLKTTTIQQSPFGPVTLPFNWNSSCFYEFGVTRYLDCGWHLSGGYIYSENSVPSGSFNPLVPDSDRHIWSIGAGSQYKNLSWDVAYQLAWGPSRTINSSPNGNPTVNGTYEFLSNAIIISLGYTF